MKMVYINSLWKNWWNASPRVFLVSDILREKFNFLYIWQFTYKLVVNAI